MGENNIFDKLIVMGDSRFPDKSDGFANFLTVSRNFTLVVCTFFILCTLCSRSSWQMILSQTNTFNIFPCSLLITYFIKILPSHCNR